MKSNLLRDVLLSHELMQITPKDVFVSKRDALVELSRRRKNHFLKHMLDELAPHATEFAAAHLPRPRAILFRQVATPTHEILRFLKTAKQMHLRPLIFEYLDDTFVGAGNTYKRSLGKMPIYQYTGSDGRDMVQFHPLFDFNRYVGKRLSDISCANGEGLIELHHRLLARFAKIRISSICVDASPWLKQHGSNAPTYYKSFLSLFLYNAILFENYENTPPVQKFFKSTVAPAFVSLQQEFGHSPLIVKLLPEEEEMRLFWDSYPKKVQRLI